MRTLLLAAVLLSAPAALADCITIQQAPEKIGADTCVTGKVLKVVESPSGAWFLDFCEDYRSCPFSVVVFPSNLRDVGDVRLLQGKTIEVHGRIKLYKGRAEIVLRDRRQLKGDFGKIPSLPKGYDAERRGNAPARAPSVKPKQPSAEAAPDSSPPR
jgi:hypothetical protein